MKNDAKQWDYNPSRWCPRILVCIFAGVAVLIATYMGLYEWKLIDYIWDPVFGSETMKVLDSDLSHELTRLFHLPDSILGAISYLGDVILALAGSTHRWYDRPWLVFIFGLNVIPLSVVSFTLVAMQKFVVGHYCFLCFITASISIILIYLSYDEVKTCLIFLIRLWKKSKNASLLWNTFWGKASMTAFEVSKETATVRYNQRNHVGKNR